MIIIFKLVLWYTIFKWKGGKFKKKGKDCNIYMIYALNRFFLFVILFFCNISSKKKKKSMQKLFENYYTKRFNKILLLLNKCLRE